jgi:hypothetical protein
MASWKQIAAAEMMKTAVSAYFSPCRVERIGATVPGPWNSHEFLLGMPFSRRQRDVDGKVEHGVLPYDARVAAEMLTAQLGFVTLLGTPRGYSSSSRRRRGAAITGPDRREASLTGGATTRCSDERRQVRRTS